MRTFFALAAAIFVSTAAHADPAYYIELGRAPSEQVAAQQWQALSTQYKAIIGDLDFYPETIVQADRRTVVRIHAGPIEEKGEAHRLCRTLFAENQPCFVLEGRIAQPRAQATQASMPWQRTAYKNEGILPWLFSTEEEMRRSMPVSEGEVDVAEAIRVPVSEKTAQTPAPAVEPLLAPPMSRLPMAAGQAGWLNVSAFGNEQSAAELWQKVRAHAPERAAGLRVRIVKSLVQGDRPVSLNVGPFATSQGAMEFCAQGVNAVDKGLHCQFGAQEPKGAAKSLLPTFSQRSEQYAERRRAARVQYTLASNTNMKPHVPAPHYWVQVVAAGSEFDAMQAWDSLKTRHNDLLGSLRSSLSAPLAKGADYTVRVGPMPSNNDAVSLCVSLQGRGVNCRIYRM